MKANIGEEIVGAYLTEVLECQYIAYNARPPGGGVAGLDELDVVGFDFKQKKVYLCEVTTHILGALYTDNKTTVEKLVKKHLAQQRYAENHLTDFPKREYMFWSPSVPVGYITTNLEKRTKRSGLQLVINGEYKRRIEELRRKARTNAADTNNAAFRMLQILEHLRD
jgi:hypothetical protein